MFPEPGRGGPRSSGTTRSKRDGAAAARSMLPPAARASARGPSWKDRRVRVCILTTSYPRSEDDVAGRFVAEAVEHLRSAGVEVDVVSPATFRHFGIAYGG